MPSVLAQPELCLRLLHLTTVDAATTDVEADTEVRPPTTFTLPLAGSDDDLRAIWARVLERTEPSTIAAGELRLVVAPGTSRTEAVAAARAASMMVTETDADEAGVKNVATAPELLRALFSDEGTFFKFGRLRFAVV